MSRTRSEYRLTPLPADFALAPSSTTSATAHEIRLVDVTDREQLAVVLLAAYRGSVHDEDETEDDALDAIDEYFELMLPQHSFVVVEADRVIAMSFVVIVREVNYIDPVATTASAKRRGVGTAVVQASLRSLADAGVTEVGAVITDGNAASEALFTNLGFERVGDWV